MRALLILLLLLPSVLKAQLKVEDFRKGETDDVVVINRALSYLDSIGHGTLVFEGTRTYRVDAPLELPRHRTKGRRIMILEGSGCTIQAKNDTVSVFRRIPKNQKEALNKMMATRFTFQNFNIRGGGKGIDLGASYGTSIRFCNFRSQNYAAVDVQLGLNTHIDHCNSTGGRRDNFVLRTGEDWGGNGANSQSNHSVVERCRVYAAKGSKTAFKVLGSNGVVLRDNISEGQKDIDYCFYINGQGSNHVKFIKLENLHLEHAPIKGAIYANLKGNLVVDGVYYQMSRDETPLLHVGPGVSRVTLANIPWWVSGSTINVEAAKTKWLVEMCIGHFRKPKVWRMKKGDSWKADVPNSIQFCH